MRAKDKENQNAPGTEGVYQDFDATESEGEEEDEDDKKSHSNKNGGSRVRSDILIHMFQANLTYNQTAQSPQDNRTTVS